MQTNMWSSAILDGKQCLWLSAVSVTNIDVFTFAGLSYLAVSWSDITSRLWFWVEWTDFETSKGKRSKHQMREIWCCFDYHALRKEDMQIPLDFRLQLHLTMCSWHSVAGCCFIQPFAPCLALQYNLRIHVLLLYGVSVYHTCIGFWFCFQSSPFWIFLSHWRLLHLGLLRRSFTTAA